MKYPKTINVRWGLIDARAKIEESTMTIGLFFTLCVLNAILLHPESLSENQDDFLIKTLHAFYSIIFGLIAIAITACREIAIKRLKNLEKLCLFCGSKENTFYHKGTLGKSNKFIGLEPGRYCKHCIEGYVPRP